MPSPVPSTPLPVARAGRAVHGLSDEALDVLRRCLLPFADRIDRVALFGSRAQGGARPASDIDLVIYGDLSEADVDRLWTLFDESSLPMTVDVLAYHLIAHPPLRRHVDAVARTLFTRDDLAVPASSTAGA